MYGRSCFWRVTMMPARFVVFDARMVIFVALFLLHVRIWTLCVLVVACILFFLLERRGLTLPAALRLTRAFLAGSRRPAIQDAARRGRIWFGFEGVKGGRFDLESMRETAPRFAVRPISKTRTAGKRAKRSGRKRGKKTVGTAGAQPAA